MAQYEHRKIMMKVNQQLGSEEFNSLAYLMCVPDEIVEATQSDRDRIRILRYLEKQNIIGPHNYHRLVDVLDTLGRRDLITQITLEDPEGVAAKLPYIPQSIEPQQLAWLAKRETMLSRKERYIGCMKDLTVIIHSGPAIKNRFSDLFSRAISAMGTEQNQIVPQYQECAASTLSELSLFWQRWPIAFATYQQSGDICNVKPLIGDCHSCFDRFNHELPPSWERNVREHVVLQRNKAQHPIGKLAREAHSALHALSAELIGEQPLIEDSKRTREAIFILESANYIAQYLIPIYKWLMTLVHSVSLSVTDASKVCATLKVIFLDHCDDIARNKDILEGIFGEETLSRISNELLQDKIDKDYNKKCNIDVSTYASIISSISVVWHVVLIMLAMKSLNYDVDYRAIQQKLVQFTASRKGHLMQMYVNLSKRRAQSMQKVMDLYKENCEQKISQLVGGAPEKIVHSLFVA